jgi:Xaa-Pro aminopeptidase
LSDTGKAAVVAETSESQRRTWHKLVETQSAILERIKPGVNTRELWQVLIDKFKQFDLEPSITFLGHGIGLSLHEEPYITARSDTILEPGMVFCIEPVYKVPGEMGFHIEDEVAVTEDGYELFTDFDGARELTIIGQ